MPSGVNLPTFLVEGPLTWPGQHAGFLGPRHDPWQISRDPNAADFRVDSLRLAAGLGVDRLDDRRALLEQVDRQQQALADLAEAAALSDQQQKAFAMLTSGKLAQAFEMEREPVAVRDRYGRHAFGQSLLLARRLVQAGVPVVQANMGRVQNWDTHGDNFRRLKKQSAAAAGPGRRRPARRPGGTGPARRDAGDDAGRVRPHAEDRRPAGSQGAGRDHWAPCFFGLFAGAGVRGGQVIGKSDKIGAYPATTPYSPDDVGATVYHVLGVDPASEVRDRQDRPTQLNRGSIMQSLFTGTARERRLRRSKGLLRRKRRLLLQHLRQAPWIASPHSAYPRAEG